MCHVCFGKVGADVNVSLCTVYCRFEISTSNPFVAIVQHLLLRHPKSHIPVILTWCRGDQNTRGNNCAKKASRLSCSPSWFSDCCWLFWDSVVQAELDFTRNQGTSPEDSEVCRLTQSSSIALPQKNLNILSLMLRTAKAHISIPNESENWIILCMPLLYEK